MDHILDFHNVSEENEKEEEKEEANLGSSDDRLDAFLCENGISRRRHRRNDGLLDCGPRIYQSIRIIKQVETTTEWVDRDLVGIVKFHRTQKQQHLCGEIKKTFGGVVKAIVITCELAAIEKSNEGRR